MSLFLYKVKTVKSGSGTQAPVSTLNSPGPYTFGTVVVDVVVVDVVVVDVVVVDVVDVVVVDVVVGDVVVGDVVVVVVS